MVKVYQHILYYHHINIYTGPQYVSIAFLSINQSLSRPSRPFCGSGALASSFCRGGLSLGIGFNVTRPPSLVCYHDNYPLSHIHHHKLSLKHIISSFKRQTVYEGYLWEVVLGYPGSETTVIWILWRRNSDGKKRDFWGILF